MMNATHTPLPSLRPLLLTGSGLIALAALTGCSTSEDPATTPAPEQSTPAAAPAESTPAESAATDDAATDDATQEATQPAVASDDPVFEAIAAVTEQHADGIIVGIDRDDRDEDYDVDVVVGEEVLDLKVGLDGTVTEEERERDEDDVRQAQEASIDAESAVTRAYEGRGEGLTVDDVDLDEDDGRLTWEIDFDDADGNDADEVVIDAQDGSVVRDSGA